MNDLEKILSEVCKDLPKGTLPHDAMNKAIFNHDQVLKDFLTHYVDEDFIKDLDFSDINDLPTEFVTEDMRRRYSDCIKKIKWRGRDAYLLIILEFQSTKDVWIPVRILAYTALLWLDLIQSGKITKTQGLPPVFPIVIHSGSENWVNQPCIRDLLSPMPNSLLKYQPQNLALLINEKTIKDQILNNNSDFYSLYLQLKRSKTPIEMRDIIIRYKKKLSKSCNYELLKTILALLSTLYKCFKSDIEDSSNIRFTSLEESIKMLENAAIDWKANTIRESYDNWKNETIEKDRNEWKNETIEKDLNEWKNETIEKEKYLWEKNYTDNLGKNIEKNTRLEIAKKLFSTIKDIKVISNATGLSCSEIDTFFKSSK